MLCPHCGKDIGQQDKFCWFCGQQVAVKKKGRLWPPIAIIVILACLGLTMFYTLPLPGDSVTEGCFRLENGTLYFDESRYTGGSELTVPKTIAGQPVTTISEGCFRDCDSLTAVFLPEGIQQIEEEAFFDCDRLRGIFLPDDLNSIGSRAFYSCDALEAICIPGSTDTIGSSALADCNRLRHIFYAGSKTSWTALYPESLHCETMVYAADNSFLHNDSL